MLVIPFTGGLHSTASQGTYKFLGVIDFGPFIPVGTTFDRVVLSAEIMVETTTPFTFINYMPSELDPANQLVKYVGSNSNNALLNVIRTLQLMSGMAPTPPFEIPTDDINGDGKIGIAEAIDFLKQSSL